MGYIVNPKTDGSRIICCIPQTGTCPNKCWDCFFQSGRSYLEPLEVNLPNMPSLDQSKGMIVRVNDGNDSSFQRPLVLSMIKEYGYRDVFFNTATPFDLNGFRVNGKLKPVVVTANPAKMTDKSFHKLDPVPLNLMFIRFRVNTWNLELTDKVVEHYTQRGIPVVLTFMAYYNLNPPKGHEDNYSFRKRTLNSYFVITEDAWNMIIQRYQNNPMVFTCGKDAKTHACSECNNCEKLYHRAMKKIE